MGRIRLNALRVRKRALADLETRRTSARPCWLDIVTDVPPSTQTLVRPLPVPQPLLQIRTKTLPSPNDPSISKPTQVIEEVASKPTRKAKNRKPSRLFAPLPITYEEDTLRTRFFTDHPWELARPRVILETTGSPSPTTDWSTGLSQPAVPLSGESVVQRQLHLLQTTPDITVDAAYDVARKEFYQLRRQEELGNRIAAEEAEATGAEFGPGAIEVSSELEGRQYDDWERWSRGQVVEMMQKMAAFEGGGVGAAPGSNASPLALDDDAPAVADVADDAAGVVAGGGRQGVATPARTAPLPRGSSGGVMGSRVFAGEQQRSAGMAGRGVLE